MYIGRNLDEDWKDLPVSLAMSMGIHESQSLLWERMVWMYYILTNTYYNIFIIMDSLYAIIVLIQFTYYMSKVGLSKSFQTYLLPKIKEFFPAFPDVSSEKLYSALNCIQEPSLIRVESDELTYTLHVILR